MFALANSTQINASLPGIDKVERLAFIFNKCFRPAQRLRQIFIAKFSPQDYLPWYFFNSVHGARLVVGGLFRQQVPESISVEEYFSALTKNGSSKLGVRLLLRQLAAQGLFVCEPFEPGKEMLFAVLATQHVECDSANGFAIGFNEAAYQSLTGCNPLNIDYTLQEKSHMRLIIELESAAIESLINGHELSVSIGKAKFFNRQMEINMSNNPTESEQESMLMTIESVNELYGNPADCNVQFAVEIGAFEMELNTVVRLRRGMCIELDLPRAFEANLIAGGTAWAKAEAKILGSKLQLRISRIPADSHEVGQDCQILT